MKFRQFIQKKHAVMGKTDLSRHRVCAPAQKSRIGNRMVRRTKRSLGHERLMRFERAGNTVDFCGLQRFLKGQRRKNTRHPLGQHALAGARRANRQQIVSTRHRHLDRPLGPLLPFDIAVIIVVVGMRDKEILRIDGVRLNGQPTGQKIRRFPQRAHRIYRHAFHHRSLLGVIGRHQQSAAALIAGHHRDG